MDVLLVFNQGNFKNLIEIENELKSLGHNIYMPENSLLRNHKTDISTMNDDEIRNYIRFVKQHIKEMDCLLIVNNNYNEKFNDYDIDSIARLKMHLAIYCSKPIFVMNDFFKISKKDYLPICINNNFGEISAKYSMAKKKLAYRKQKIKDKKNDPEYFIKSKTFNKVS